MLTCRLEHVHEPPECRCELGGRGGSQPRRCQVDDAVDGVDSQNVEQRPTAGQVHRLHAEPRPQLRLEKIGQPPGAKPRQDHLLAGVQETARQVQADEPHAARDEDHRGWWSLPEL